MCTPSVQLKYAKFGGHCGPQPHPIKTTANAPNTHNCCILNDPALLLNNSSPQIHQTYQKYRYFGIWAESPKLFWSEWTCLSKLLILMKAYLKRHPIKAKI